MEMMYLSLSELRSNYEGESRIHFCVFAKPVVSQGCLPHFPTEYLEFPARSIYTTSIKLLLGASPYSDILQSREHLR